MLGPDLRIKKKLRVPPPPWDTVRLPQDPSKCYLVNFLQRKAGYIIKDLFLKDMSRIRKTLSKDRMGEHILYGHTGDIARQDTTGFLKILFQISFQWLFLPAKTSEDIFCYQLCNDYIM